MHNKRSGRNDSILRGIAAVKDEAKVKKTKRTLDDIRRGEKGISRQTRSFREVSH